MSKRFKVEHNDMEKGYYILHYINHHMNDENILSKTGWKQKDVTITEVHQGEIK